MINLISENTSSKVNWQGKIVSIQPRTRVWRYLTDNRTHYHLGYNFFIEGYSCDSKKQFTVAISEKQQLKGLYRVGDILEGTAWTKKYEEREFADYYKVGSLKLLERVNENFEALPPPWVMMPPSIQTYEERGARILSKSQWDFDKDIKKYRFETFCYGPKSCKHYKMGRPRSVPYKNRGSALDDGYLDELCTEGRDDDD
ncbi:hypothetical protein DFR58_12439 [Anaerobacterium chartisolvens]|uniref:Uncharacterized protein n=1 Tax=Anaerobacterium chartisolvens TaxID=1297424 RepID=A0A369ARV6_9FIRM|nr:hypothetical protein [Anaerobacterium chartisolvens]RCX12089.1 hypothetical protein DFR58_12439 [Anaerobacterium chartisolvens]